MQLYSVKQATKLYVLLTFRLQSPLGREGKIGLTGEDETFKSFNQDTSYDRKFEKRLAVTLKLKLVSRYVKDCLLVS